MSDITSYTLLALCQALASGEVSATMAAQACLERMAATEPKLKAMLNFNPELPLSAAERLDQAGYNPDKPLWGVPITIKDNLLVKGWPATAASAILRNFSPFYEATAVEKLRAAGAVILGKTNMDEFGMGSSTENSSLGPTSNPWDVNRVPGGSSGGSAAGVAAGQAFASLGTDTGGSIRQPASLCGCVGLKPTYGRVSRYGVIAYGSSFDQIGPLTRSVADAAKVLGVIAGHDPKDSTSADVPVPDYMAGLSRQDMAGLRLGLPKEYWAGEGLDAEVARSLSRALDQARDLGAELVEVSLPHTRYAIAAYYILVMAEASSNLARYDGVRYGVRSEQAEDLKDLYEISRTDGFGEEVKRRIMLGTYVLSAGYYDAYYRKAAQIRRLIVRDFEQAFEQCDLLLTPISPIAAWEKGAKRSDPLQMYLLDAFTVPVNMAGLPGLALPVGLGADSGMPVGLQIVGRAFDEAGALSVGAVLEKALPALGRPIGV